MIRRLRIANALLDAWLVDQKLAAPAVPQYRLRLWKADDAAFPAVRAELIAYLQEALDDARTRLREGFEDALSPFAAHHTPDPADGFPELLHRITLQGYLGETLAVAAVEHWGAHSHADWQVPALLFRFHTIEFQHLGQIQGRISAGETHEPDGAGHRRPGRTGDDALAFRISNAGNITDVLTLEAKCLGKHQSAMVGDACDKLVESVRDPVPNSVRELINLLSKYNTDAAKQWHEALLSLLASHGRQVQSFNAIGYACGNAPKQRASWVAASKPPPQYTIHRPLEVMEFHLNDVDALVDAVYR